MKVDDFNQIDELRETVEIHFPVSSRIRCWAFKNAYTLVFLTTLFAITWIVQAVLAIVF